MKSNRSDILDMTLVPVCALLIVMVIVALVTESSKKKIHVIELNLVNQLQNESFVIDSDANIALPETVEETSFCQQFVRHPLVCNDQHAAVCFLGKIQ